jgi:uncharacterized repeat protein (TIGR03803 family)
LYGTTATGGSAYLGVVFSVTPSGDERTLHSFTGQPDGENPYGSLVAMRGTLYGTTSFGGAHGDGTVFSITPSGQESVLYSFKGASYGDGQMPLAGLIAVGGELYGTTYGGGSGDGTVFAITPSGKERVIYRFAPYRNDGQDPEAALLYVNGTLYGTTIFGGDASEGTVFSITTAGKEKVLHSFKGPPDGGGPIAGLIDVNGTLYGTTWEGGLSYGEGKEGIGAVFSITPGGKERVLHRFHPAPDASLPGGGVIELNGSLVGAAASGGVHEDCPESYGYGCGAIFALTPAPPI